eukprot:m51a1_g11159 hypothetical protein (255) ;mRNA; f:284058-284822
MLVRTVESVFAHMREYEPRMEYQTVWVDQAPSPETEALAHKYPFASRAVAPHSMGFTWPYNVALFGLCTAPYVVLLEEDFPLVRGAEKGLIRPDFLRQAIEVVEANEGVHGVLLRQEADPDMWGSGKYGNYTAHEDARGNKWCYRWLPRWGCLALRSYASSWTNGAALYSLKKLRAAGPLQTLEECPKPNLNTEWCYGRILFDMNMTLASVQRRARCQPCDSACNYVSEHIGNGKGHSTKSKGSACRTRTAWGY